MRKTPTAELDPYAYDMVMFYLQEHNIKISDVDSIEVTLRKDRDNKIYYRNINIIKKDTNKNPKSKILSLLSIFRRKKSN